MTGISGLWPWNWGSDVENTFLQLFQLALETIVYIVEWLTYWFFYYVGLVIALLAQLAIDSGVFALPVFVTLMVGLILMLQVSLDVIRDIPVAGAVA